MISAKKHRRVGLELSIFKWVVCLQLLVLPRLANADRAFGKIADTVVPTLGYTVDAKQNRQLIFMNNPEFLLFGRDECDLADEMPRWRRMTCARSLFKIDTLNKGRYRAWWEHRNMMPFAVHSGVLVTNNSHEEAHIVVENDAIETNSLKNGGNEFVQIFNSNAHNSEFKLAPGEKRFLGTTTNKTIRSGNFFAGVVDFEIKSGSVTFEEVVFKDQPAGNLSHIGYSSRTMFKVHESLVYKGVSQVSAMRLDGAEFAIDDNSLEGPLPLAYKQAEVVPLAQLDSTCRPDRVPACSGAALKMRQDPVRDTAWVTHIAPDPEDANPKRKRAILSDLVELVLPGSTSGCLSLWPQSNPACMVMSHNHFWYLHDFKKWRLPNWGNWGVVYSHPIKIKNNGFKNRFVKVYITADGASPLAFRGTGMGNQWQQIFLDPKASSNNPASALVARSHVLALGETELKVEFVLSGPGAGTLEHRVELMDSEDD